MGCHALLQGIFLTQGLNLHLLQFLHCRQIRYRCHQGSPLYEEGTIIFILQMSKLRYINQDNCLRSQWVRTWVHTTNVKENVKVVAIMIMITLYFYALFSFEIACPHHSRPSHPQRRLTFSLSGATAHFIFPLSVTMSLPGRTLGHISISVA